MLTSGLTGTVIVQLTDPGPGAAGSDPFVMETVWLRAVAVRMGTVESLQVVAGAVAGG